MKTPSFGSHTKQWIAGIVFVFTSSCGNPQITPIPQIIPATQIVESTQLIPATQIVNVTQVIPVTQVVRVTRFIPVTRIVQMTQIVEIPRIVTILAEEPPAPAPTEAPALTTAPFPTPTKLKVNNDLLVWYNFEDDFITSGFVSDVSGNGFDAQINGNVNVDDGIFGGNSIFFFGDSYILAPVNPAGGRNTVSFSLWFKTEHPENNYKLASAAWWSGGPGSGWILATHIPEFWSDDTQSIYMPNLANNENYFASDEWIHEVITYDGIRIKEYTNGQLINDWQTTGAVIGQSETMAVGAWPQFGFDFMGCIDEFQIFARSLTGQEVKALYNQGW